MQIIIDFFNSMSREGAMTLYSLGYFVAWQILFASLYNSLDKTMCFSDDEMAGFVIFFQILGGTVFYLFGLAIVF